jgi:hypothetical protein
MRIKWLKPTCHSSLLPACDTLWGETRQFQLRGQPVARSLTASR